MDLKDIKELIALMRRNDLSELEIEQEGLRIKLKKGSEPMIGHAPMAYAAVPQPAAGAAPAAQAAAPAAEEKPKGREISSPMVGTFYGAASPEANSYVEVGTEINEETVVCIIEAMKVMNEIKAETKGVIAEILAENGKPVQFGQPLFRLK
ncbi:MAG TPA: acetyl-CoA carboxylase biotin carboxyl carrier protein [Chthoniobacteraceae bacterium]|nr:acetyl-CoA carboxylase biotin carboxyl carrier protein [Chthoniobacteraceae bacterium]